MTDRPLFKLLTLQTALPLDISEESIELGSDRKGVFAWRSEFLAYHDNDMNRRYVEAGRRRRERIPYPIATDDELHDA